ncbi:hypothetical protein LM602_05295 [Candidatus Acetothermia bacterium]|jgi:plastocyanin|nr:hypothetical protein [Candidatus Acetothermia bacterium]MCI2431958.1 hypothetical protein [Candidatus Acetothermia bacterium]MCI2436721.1 hypothetical protein [Candidatus Acetothermia bacterium]
MERWLALLAGIVALLLGALWFWLRGSPPPSTTDAMAQPKVFVIEIRDLYFDPPGLTLRPGDRVVWVLKENAHGDGHTVTAYHPSQDRPLRIPSGAAPWNSHLMTTIGQTFSQGFSVPGIYDYFCAPHEQQGMVGRIIVGEGTALAPDERGLPAAALSAIPTMDELKGSVGEAFNAIALLQGVLYLAQQGQTAAAWTQLQVLQKLVREGPLAIAIQQRGIQVPLESRLAALGTLLLRGAPLTALEPTAAQIRTLLGRFTQGE